MPQCIVSEQYQFVAGVDTHAKTHHLTLIDNLGTVIGKREIKVLPQAMVKSIDWVMAKTGGNVLFAIEGTSSYGETFTILLQNRNLPVCEVKAPKTKTRGQAGKTDEIDSLLAARNILIKPVDKLIIPKTQGMRKVFRLLLAARRNMTVQKVMDENALIALLRTNNLDIIPAAKLTPVDLQTIAQWQAKPTGNICIEVAVARMEAKRLAQSILLFQAMLKQNERQLHQAVKMFAPTLLDFSGFGPVTSAQILCSYSHKGRFRSANAFACLAGTTPLPASSGKVVRHRLSRYGDRALNSSLTTIIMSRLQHHEPTKEYSAKCTAQGKSLREIRRSLKRYLARGIFKHLEQLDLTGSYAMVEIG
jgi:transposase